MATSVSGTQYDEDRTRFFRLSLIIIDELTQILRDLLYNEVHPTQIKNNLLQKNYLQKLRPEQVAVISDANTNGYKDFDITLLYTLLRNVCNNKIPPPSQSWGVSKMPSQNEVTVGDDVERIRLVRNTVFGHISEAAITETEFQEYFTIISDICTRMQTLLKKDYVRRLRDMEGCTIDSSTENKYIELIKRLADEEKTTRGLLQELTSNETIVIKPKLPKKRKLEESIDNASIELLNTMVDLVHTTTSESEIDHLYESVVEFITANKEVTEDLLLGHLYEKLKEKIKSYANLQGPNQMRILARFLKFSLTFKKVYRASMECSHGSILLHVTFSSRKDYDLYKKHLRNGRIGRQILELFSYPPFLGSFGLEVVDIEISLNYSLLTPHKDMKQDSRISEADSVGMCHNSGRGVKDTEEAVMRVVWIMRGFDKMETGSSRDEFWLPQSDPEHDIAPGARPTVLKVSLRFICKILTA